MAPVVEVAARGSSLEVILSDPAGQNLVTPMCLDGLMAALDEYSDRTRAVLIAARGANFCVGALPPLDADLVDQFADRFHSVLARIEDISVPVVVAAHGGIAGAGLSLALTGDVVVLSQDARLSTRGVHGVRASGGLTWRLPAAVGHGVAMDLLLTGRVLDADQAVGLGLAARVVAPTSLLAEARSVVGEIAMQPRESVVGLKRLVRDSRRRDLGLHLPEEEALLR